MTQIDDIRHPQAGARSQSMPSLPFPTPPADDMVEESAPAPPTNGTASFALVMSLLWLMGIGALLGLVFGIIGAWQCQRTGAPGRGMALAAVLLGLVGLVFSPPLLPLL